MSTPLSSDAIQKLLNKAKTPETPKPFKKYQVPRQTSSILRWTDKSLRCASRGCSAPTNILVSGIPYCSIHSLNIMADLIDERINSNPKRSPMYEAVLKAHIDLAEIGGYVTSGSGETANTVDLKSTA